jgi:hypothetical protein
MLALPVGAQTPTDPYQPLTGSERWRVYLRDTYLSPGGWMGAAGPALAAHLNHEPEVWGQGLEGYSKRFANRFGRMALRKSYEAAGAAALGHEVRYIPSRRKRVISRIGYALIANFVTYDRHGGRTPHVARVGSVFAAQFTAAAWMPDGYRDMTTVMRGAGVELGVSSGLNLVKEFTPEIKRLFKRK